MRPCGFGADAAEDPVDQHGRPSRRSRTGVRRRLLGGQSAPPGAVQPGRGRGCGRPRHVRRSQPAPTAHLCHRRHAEVNVVDRPLHRHLGDEARGRRNSVLPCATRRTRCDGRQCRRGRLADVPPSPWLHSRYWFASSPLTQQLPDTHPLLGVHVELPSGRDHVWQADSERRRCRGWPDHKVNGQAVVPAAAFAEMALAAGREVLGLPVDAVQVTGLEVEQPLALDRQTRVTTQLAQSDNGIRVEIYASSAGSNWSRHAVADVDMMDDGWPGRHADAWRFGDRNRAARRGCRPSGLLHSPADTRCGAAASRCRDVSRIAGGSDRDPLSAGVIGDDPGVRAGRTAGPVPHRAGELRA